jgi:hypothetical protein
MTNPLEEHLPDGRVRFHICSWSHYPKNGFFHALVFDREGLFHLSIKEDNLPIEPSYEEKIDIINRYIRNLHERKNSEQGSSDNLSNSNDR